MRSILAVTLFLLYNIVGAQQKVKVQNEVTYVGNTPFPGLYTFLGIRYANPVERWKSPVAYSGSNEELQATSFGSDCIQKGGEGSEDCLFLNIFTPSSATPSSNLPVRLFIHGGSFITGSGSIYNASYLVLDPPMILVSINYRIGLFGFMASDELLAEGNGKLNYGLQDQQLAMKWTFENIKNFGGDPNNITLWGESAGGSSIALHLLMNGSWPYFNRVIMNSPGPWNFFNSTYAAQRTKLALSSMGYSFNLVRGAPASLISSNIPVLPFGWPVLDAQLSAQPLELFAQGKYKKVEIIVGVNGDEGTWLTLFPQGKTFAQTGFEVNQAYGVHGDLMIKVGQAYGMPSVFSPIVPPVFSDEFQSVSDFVGDYFINCGSKYLADITKSSGKTFVYYFTRVPPTTLGSQFGAYHSGELYYGFKGLKVINGTDGNSYTGGDVVLSDRMAQYLHNFQAKGNPNPGIVEWPPYSNDALRFDLDISTVSLPSFGNCSFLLPYLKSDPYHFDLSYYPTLFSSSSPSNSASNSKTKVSSGFKSMEMSLILILGIVSIIQLLL